MTGTPGLDGLHRPPAPGPDDPLGMLRACHQRMAEHCALLERLLEQPAAAGPDDEAIAAAARVLRYFSTAAMDHHQDEELGLFPLLAELDLAAGLIERLRAEHPELEQAWGGLQPLIESVTLGRAVDPVELRRQALPFIEAYRRHLDLENAELLPLAEQWLSAAQKRRLGADMAARRGIPLD